MKKIMSDLVAPISTMLIALALGLIVILGCQPDITEQIVAITLGLLGTLIVWW